MKLILILMFVSGIYNAQSDSLKCFTIKQQKEILTKFELLDECEQLRSNDSILLNTQDSVINDLNTHNAILVQMDKDNKQELNKRRKNVFKALIGGFAFGVISTVLVIVLG